MVILDGYHAAGIVPFDVTELNVDFYLAGVLKWMCGGPGGVFLYARPDLSQDRAAQADRLDGSQAPVWL